MPKTKLSAAYKDFGRKKKTFASGLTAIRQLEQEQQFKSKKLGLEQQQTQDFFTHTGQLIGLAGTGASMLGEYQEGQEAMEAIGQADYEEVLKERKSKQPDSLDTDSPFYSAGALGIEEWSDLTPEQKQEWMPQKDYGFDTTTRWGKWGKTFADISELTGDWDPDYVLGTGKTIKMSHMKSLYDLSQVQDIAKEYGIDLYKNDKNTGDGSKSLKSIHKTYSTAADETVKTETPGKWDLSTDKYFKDLAEKQTMKRWVSDLFKNLKVGSEAELGDYDEIETNAPISGNQFSTPINLGDDINYSYDLESELERQSGYFE
jgi:hypothetical protein